MLPLAGAEHRPGRISATSNLAAAVYGIDWRAPVEAASTSSR